MHVSPAPGTADPRALKAETQSAALAFLTSLAAEVSRGAVDLPCFPNIVIQIRNALADPKNTPERTVILVGAEPRLAARLLQTANSAAFNPAGRPLTDLRNAITRLGHQLVQSAAMAFAVKHMKDEHSLRSIAASLGELWKESIAVASICQVVARRTAVSSDEAFLTGLMHGIGRLYIMVRGVDRAHGLDDQEAFIELIDGWHASIGKAVLENWGFAEEMSAAVGDQRDHDRRHRGAADLTDVLVASIGIAEALAALAPRTVNLQGVCAFTTIGLTVEDCTAILAHAELQLASLQDALGC